MLYHASKEKGLTILEPRVSTHGIAYVYAINNRITAACFGALKDDFDLLMDEINGIPHLYECYPHAIEAIYSGKAVLYMRSEKKASFQVKQDGKQSLFVSIRFRL